MDLVPACAHVCVLRETVRVYAQAREGLRGMGGGDRLRCGGGLDGQTMWFDEKLTVADRLSGCCFFAFFSASFCLCVRACVRACREFGVCFRFPACDRPLDCQSTPSSFDN